MVLCTAIDRLWTGDPVTVAGLVVLVRLITHEPVRLSNSDGRWRMMKVGLVSSMRVGFGFMAN